MSNELTIYNAMTNESNMPYCSVSATDGASATLIFNAMNNADEAIDQYINQSIEVAGVFVQKIYMTDEKTGEANELPKVVLFDSNGHTYATASKGMYNSLCNVCMLLGDPAHWKSPITVKILQTKVKKGTMLSFEVIDWGENYPDA